MVKTTLKNAHILPILPYFCHFWEKFKPQKCERYLREGIDDRSPFHENNNIGGMCFNGHDHPHILVALLRDLDLVQSLGQLAENDNAADIRSAADINSLHWVHQMNLGIFHQGTTFCKVCVLILNKK